MSLSRSILPSDPDELRIFAARLQTECAAIEAELYAKTLHIEKLKSQLAVLRRARFGRSSERLDREIEQLELLIGEIEEDGAAQAQGRRAPTDVPTAPQRECARPARKSLPAHLPRERVEHEAACVCPTCGGAVLSVIGTDEREVLEYVPSHFKVIVHARPRLSCRACESITQAPMPGLPIERGLPGPGLLADVLMDTSENRWPNRRRLDSLGHVAIGVAPWRRERPAFLTWTSAWRSCRPRATIWSV